MENTCVFTFFAPWVELCLSIFTMFHSSSYIQSADLLIYREDHRPYLYVSVARETTVSLPNTKSIWSKAVEENDALNTKTLVKINNYTYPFVFNFQLKTCFSKILFKFFSPFLWKNKSIELFRTLLFAQWQNRLIIPDGPLPLPWLFIEVFYVLPAS